MDSTTTRTARWLGNFLQLNDSFYPTGSYAHSFGLEGLAQENVVRDRETLRNFILGSVLPSLKQTELPLVAHAWRALAEPDWTSVRTISFLSSALKTAKEARSAAEAIGRQRVELAAALHSNPLAIQFLERAKKEAWPFSPAVAVALEGRIHGAPLEAVVTSLYYGAIASLLAAAMKLLRLGQNGSQTLLTEAMSQAPSVIDFALAVEQEDIGWFNPWLDIAAARHETADGRLFIS